MHHREHEKERVRECVLHFIYCCWLLSLRIALRFYIFFVVIVFLTAVSPFFFSVFKVLSTEFALIGDFDCNALSASLPTLFIFHLF